MAALDFPSSPTVGQTYQGWTWDGEKWSGGAVTAPATAITFAYSGKPLAGQILMVPMVFPITVPASLAGGIGWANTVATNARLFTLNKISAAGASTALGTVTVSSGNSGSMAFAGAGGSLAAGDSLQMIAPSPQDPTMADVSVTISVARA